MKFLYKVLLFVENILYMIENIKKSLNRQIWGHNHHFFFWRVGKFEFNYQALDNKLQRTDHKDTLHIYHRYYQRWFTVLYSIFLDNLSVHIVRYRDIIFLVK